MTKQETLIDKLEQRKQDFESRFASDFWILEGLDEAINIVKLHQAESGWISVSERLPNDGDIVEVYRDSYKWGDLIWQCLYTESKGFRNYPVDGIGKNEKITHWKPIHPPKL